MKLKTYQENPWKRKLQGYFSDKYQWDKTNS